MDSSVSISEKTRDFILQHEDTDTYQLALQAHRYKDLPMGFVIQQIRCRQKAKNKLPSWYNNAYVIYPDETAVEQASSELTARLKSELVHGKHGVDLTGGLGIDAFYLADSFDALDYVEPDPERFNCARYNFNVLGKKNLTCFNNDSNKYLRQCASLDVIYLDPSRRNDGGSKTFLWKDCTPHVPDLMPELLARSGTVLVKASPLLDIKQGVNELEGVERVIVVSVKNECKEVLLEKCSSETGKEDVPMDIFHFPEMQYRYYHIRGSLKAEKEAGVNLSEPLNYIYLPYPGIMKAGLFRWTAENWNVFKLNMNTHVYTSSGLLDGFPGEPLEVKEIFSYGAKGLKKQLNSGKYRIICRNFPDSKDVLKKKLNLKEGGEVCLVALNDYRNKPLLIIADPVNKQRKHLT